VNITSWDVKAPIDEYNLSSAPRLGPDHCSLRKPSIFVFCLPVEELEKKQVQAIPANRMVIPSEFGATCAFLCSIHARYITGKNLLMDGGRYTGIF
jgi:3-oxoacyl-[acyl-carrier protein] reductase